LLHHALVDNLTLSNALRNQTWPIGRRYFHLFDLWRTSSLRFEHAT